MHTGGEEWGPFCHLSTAGALLRINRCREEGAPGSRRGALVSGSFLGSAGYGAFLQPRDTTFMLSVEIPSKAKYMVGELRLPYRCIKATVFAKLRKSKRYFGWRNLLHK